MNTRDSGDERVPLAAVLSNEVRKHPGLNYLEVARVGTVTVPARVALTVAQSLDAILDDLERVKTAGVRVRADVAHKELRLKVLADEVQKLHLVMALD